jgi:hypothetical protein
MVGVISGHADRSGPDVLWGVRQQRHLSRALQGGGQHPLVPSACPGLPPRLDLGPLGEVSPEPVDLLVVNALRLVDAEIADLAAASVSVIVGCLATGSWACHADSVLFSERDVVDVHKRLFA